MRPSRALIMDGFTIGKQGTAKIVQSRKFAEEEIIDNCTYKIDRIRRASGDIDRLDTQSFTHPLITAGIGCCSLDIAE